MNRQQNNLSHSIYDDKHNAATDHYGNNEVGARRNVQQQRIANGVRSGQMTAGEAAKAESHEQNINRHIAADRSANGGKLTPQERRTSTSGKITPAAKSTTKSTTTRPSTAAEGRATGSGAGPSGLAPRTFSLLS